jgi:hypothetical protein
VILVIDGVDLKRDVGVGLLDDIARSRSHNEQGSGRGFNEPVIHRKNNRVAVHDNRDPAHGALPQQT